MERPRKRTDISGKEGIEVIEKSDGLAWKRHANETTDRAMDRMDEEEEDNCCKE